MVVTAANSLRATQPRSAWTLGVFDPYIQGTLMHVYLNAKPPIIHPRAILVYIFAAFIASTASFSYCLVSLR